MGLFQTADNPEFASLEMDQATVSVNKTSFAPYMPGDFRGMTVMWGELESSTIKTKVKARSPFAPSTYQIKMDIPGH